MKVLYATTNPGKVKSFIPILESLAIDIITLKDLNIDVDVKETGETPIENATIKAKEYSIISGLPTIAMDDGLFLEGLPDNLQPKTNVRRVNGKRLNDEEMVEHYKLLVNDYGSDGYLNGYFLKGIAFCSGDFIRNFSYKAPRIFSNTQSKVITPGYPLSALQYLPKYGKYKSELTKEESEEVNEEEKKPIIGFMKEVISEYKKTTN